MRAGVVDVGSNTIRMLVADVSGDRLVQVDTGRVRLALGEEIERHGSLSHASIRAAAKAVRKLTGAAAAHGVADVDVFVTAPGRQAENGDELLAALRRAARHPVRVLSTEEEGRLAYGGAVATADVELPETLAVCDVGGASTEIAVGSPAGPHWITSLDLGSVRLTTRVDSLAAACAVVAETFAAVEPPRAQAALAVGGSARAARRLVGASLGAAELAEALRLVESLDAATVIHRFAVDPARARILPGGLAILAEVQRLLGVPLHVCNGGIREGALLAARAAVAA